MKFYFWNCKAENAANMITDTDQDVVADQGMVANQSVVADQGVIVDMDAVSVSRFVTSDIEEFIELMYDYHDLTVFEEEMINRTDTLESVNIETAKRLHRLLKATMFDAEDDVIEHVKASATYEMYIKEDLHPRDALARSIWPCIKDNSSLLTKIEAMRLIHNNFHTASYEYIMHDVWGRVINND